MDIRTENLTILFVDIAGFTATTSRQSRVQNAKLLQTFDSTLLPLIKRFKGVVVKSIGDALLITFRSPTDAMLCTMALQDAMHEHNLGVADDERIHIRVAANLGEVRVTKKDIFGEPVNVASRIEGITPADEIYLSEAVYMAMNKAEVPAQEVGFQQLAGIPNAIRVYSIPRFATPRLVPTNVEKSEQGSELLFPYGGMHHQPSVARSAFQERMAGESVRWSRYAKTAASILVVPLLALVAYQYYQQQPSTNNSNNGATIVPVTSNDSPGPPAQSDLHVNSESTSDKNLESTLVDSPINAKNQSPQAVMAETKVANEAIETNTTASNHSDNKNTAVTAANTNPATTAMTAASPAASTKPAEKNNTNVSTTEIKKVTTDKPANAVTSTTSLSSSAAKPVKPESSVAKEPVPVVTHATPVTAPPKPVADAAPAPVESARNKPMEWNFVTAKAAYRADRLTKPEYKEILNRLNDEYDSRVNAIKADYRTKKITREMYSDEIKKLKAAYYGQ